MTVASIRTNNPGAMWPGPSASKYGATGSQSLADGNQIATFDNPVNGAAAQFDLLNHSYAGMPLSAAINKWSGGNSPAAYAESISKATGLPLDAPLTPDVLSNPTVAIPLAKAAAHWEAGTEYPMSDDQWQTAFKMANGGATAPTQQPPATVADATAQPGAGLAGAQSGPASLPLPVSVASNPAVTANSSQSAPSNALGQIMGYLSGGAPSSQPAANVGADSDTARAAAITQNANAMKTADNSVIQLPQLQKIDLTKLKAAIAARRGIA